MDMERSRSADTPVPLIRNPKITTPPILSGHRLRVIPRRKRYLVGLAARFVHENQLAARAQHELLVGVQ